MCTTTQTTGMIARLIMISLLRHLIIITTIIKVAFRVMLRSSVALIVGNLLLVHPGLLWGLP